MYHNWKIVCVRYNNTVTRVSNISQFILPQQCDCLPSRPRKVVRKDNDCSRRDSGLVLGVYYNEDVPSEAAVLTASAKKYNDQYKGKLWRQLKLTPIPKLGECRIFFDMDPTFGFIAVAGLGSECLANNSVEQMDESKEAIRVAAGVGARALQEFRPKSIAVESFGHAESAAEGAGIATWVFQEYKEFSKRYTLPKLRLYDDCDFDGWNLGRQKAEAQNLARFLQEMPPNLLNPTSFAKIAVHLLCEIGINVNVKTAGWAENHDMGGFVAVAKSSCQPPLYMEICYYGGNSKDRPIVLIGKGVTFDSGCTNLKPRDELRFMRGDMAGAACVLAVIRAAAILKIPINIRGLVPLCELMPNRQSVKSGDVIKSANGKTIGIKTPSHEGRLLLSDALVHARNHLPKFILDIGTMSKELIYSLGAPACGCYTNSEELYKYLILASGYTGDRVWRMPLWNYYNDIITNCHTTDMSNCTTHPWGDSPNCAAFLKQFICDSKWIHLDTYNVTYTKGTDFPYLERGMTGRPTRTIIEFFYQLLENGKL